MSWATVGQGSKDGQSQPLLSNHGPFLSQMFLQRLGLPMLHPEQLATIVSSQPHAAYSALTHSLNGKCTFISGTVAKC